MSLNGKESVDSGSYHTSKDSGEYNNLQQETGVSQGDMGSLGNGTKRSGTPKQCIKEIENNDGKAPSNTPWEAQVGWIYAGHGEWIPIEGGQDTSGHGNALKQEPK